MDLNLTILLGRVAGRPAMPFSSMLDNDLAIIFDSESCIYFNQSAQNNKHLQHKRYKLKQNTNITIYPCVHIYIHKLKHTQGLTRFPFQENFEINYLQKITKYRQTDRHMVQQTVQLEHHHYTLKSYFIYFTISFYNSLK